MEKAAAGPPGSPLQWGEAVDRGDGPRLLARGSGPLGRDLPAPVALPAGGRGGLSPGKAEGAEQPGGRAVPHREVRKRAGGIRAPSSSAAEHPSERGVVAAGLRDLAAEGRSAALRPAP